MCSRTEGNLLVIRSVGEGDTVELAHPLETVVVKETVRGEEYKVSWRGCDVVDIAPRESICGCINGICASRRCIPRRKMFTSPERPITVPPSKRRGVNNFSTEASHN